MTHKLQTLTWTAIAASILPIVLSVPFASAQITDSIRPWSTSPVSVKQSSSSLATCRDELISRMGGSQIQVSFNNTSESVSSTATRITGTGVQRRSDRSNSRNFSFSCVVSSRDQQVSSLSYSFTGSTIFNRNGSSSSSPSPLQYR